MHSESYFSEVSAVETCPLVVVHLAVRILVRSRSWLCHVTYGY